MADRSAPNGDEVDISRSILALSAILQVAIDIQCPSTTLPLTTRSSHKLRRTGSHMDICRVTSPNSNSHGYVKSAHPNIHLLAPIK